MVHDSHVQEQNFYNHKPKNKPSELGQHLSPVFTDRTVLGRASVQAVTSSGVHMLLLFVVQVYRLS
ncbi:hypothetical protein E2C01_015135 [Portunus trituberculatus]|uniref:Uncharacterized protein n=1 Tax=Portunus trituberculatus TaxID=210409 RepID=A0A5B7DL13_PORTR|nr:hypothetical protein [Portunus trituberculatus]